MLSNGVLIMRSKLLTLVFVVVAISGCDRALFGGFPSDKTQDRGIDSTPLSELEAGIWVDPNGCDHWIIDDGVEGYLSARLDDNGKPVCSGIAPPTQTVGDYKRGQRISDPN